MDHRVTLAAAACALALAGCDNLPWSQKQDSASADSLAAQHTAAMPERPAVLPNDVLAKVNGQPVSRQDLELRVQELKSMAQAGGEPWAALPAQAAEGQLSLTALLEEQIQAELMSQDTVAHGEAMRSLETQRRWEYLRRRFLAQEWLQRHADAATVTAEEIKQAYDQIRPAMPERVQLRHIVVATEDDAKRALAQLHGGAVQFAALAQQISSGANAADGGLIPGWVVRAADKDMAEAVFTEPTTVLEPALEAAAFAIDHDTGISSDVKGADNKYHVFQLVKREAQRVRPLTEVSDQIQQMLQQDKLQAKLNALKEKAAIERFPDRLDSIMQ